MHPGKLQALMALLGRCHLLELQIASSDETIILSRQGSSLPGKSHAGGMAHTSKQAPLVRSRKNWPFTVLEVRQWAEWAHANNLQSFSVQRAGSALQFKTAPAHFCDKPAFASGLENHAIVAPCAGIFRAHHPGHPRIGAGPDTRVDSNDFAGFIQSGLLLTPVLPSAAGFIGEKLVRDGDEVAAGEPLYLFDRD